MSEFHFLLKYDLRTPNVKCFTYAKLIILTRHLDRKAKLMKELEYENARWAAHFTFCITLWITKISNDII